MSSKIPPHIARELRRHVARSKPNTTTSTSSNSSSSSASSNSTDSSYAGPKVVAGCIALAGTFYAVPYLFINWIQPLSERDDALVGGQIRRGAFNNSGSTDVGKDPYWDFKRGRRKKIGEDGCEDDGGYADLFNRDDPNEVELGDQYVAKSKRRV